MRYVLRSIVFVLISISLCTIKTTQAMDDDEEKPLVIAMPDISSRRSRVTRQDIACVINLDEPKTVVIEKPSIISRIGIPTLIGLNIAALGVSTYALWQVNSAVNKYGPDVKSAGDDFEKILSFTNQFVSVLDHCPEGKSYVLNEAVKVGFRFFSMCNCSFSDDSSKGS